MNVVEKAINELNSKVCDKLDRIAGDRVAIDELNVTTNGTYTAREGRAWNSVIVNVNGGGVDTDPCLFLDYDGTLLYSYTTEEIAALTELPPSPSHDGLVGQGWNYTLEQLKNEILLNGNCNIGQSYITYDGRTRVYINIPTNYPSDKRVFSLRLKPSQSDGVVVYWGDGNTTTTSSTSATVYEHQYASGGNYVVEIEVANGTLALQGNLHGCCICDTSDGDLSYIANYVYKVELGSNVSFGSGHTFYCCASLESITVPTSITSFNEYLFNGCSSLKTVTIPNSVTSISDRAFLNCSSLTSVTIPTGVTYMGQYVFDGCSSLSSVVIPNSITNIKVYTFNNCTSLKSVSLPSALTTIEGYAFYNCSSLLSITIPSTVTSIGIHAFDGMSAATEIHIEATTPPTLGANAFDNISNDCVFYVPRSENQSVLNAYKNASGWSGYASHIYEEGNGHN